MPSTGHEAIRAISEILDENDLIMGVALNVMSGAGDSAVTGVMSAGNTMAASIAERTGLDTVVVAAAGDSTAEEGAIEAAKAAMRAFLPLPSTIRRMTSRALEDITANRGNEEGR